MGQVAIVVEYEVKSEHRPAFEKLLRDHAIGTLEDEEGCVEFHVLVPKEDIGRVFLYEAYRDQQAYDEHRKSPRLPKLREAYKELVTSYRPVVVDVFEGWPPKR